MATITFKTGRSRTLNFSGATVGGANATYSCLQGLIAETTQSGGYLTIKCLGFEIDIRPSVSTTGYAIGDPCPSTDHGTRVESIGIQIYFDGNLVANQSNSTTLTGMMGSASIDGSGSWSVTAEVEEWCIVEDLGDLYPNDVTILDGREFPNFGGTATADGVASKSCTFIELFVPGSQIVANCSAGTVVANASVSPFLNQIVTYSIGSLGFVEAFLTSRTFSTTYELNGNEFGVVYSADNLWGSVDTQDGLAIYCNGNTSGSQDTGHSWYCDAKIQPPVDYALDILCQNFNQIYPGKLNFILMDQKRLINGQWIWSSSTFGIVSPRTLRGWGQNEYAISATADGSIEFQGAIADEVSPIRGWLDGNSLTQNLETSADWRCGIHGKPYDVMTISQVPTLQVATSIQTSTQSASLTLTVADWSGYRYLVFAASENGFIEITSMQGVVKTYSFQAGQLVTVDLCQPTSWNQLSGILPAIDSRESRFPLANGASFPDETNQPSITSNGSQVDAKGAFWGQFQVQTATITFTSGSGTQSAGPFNLVRSGNNRATFLMPFDHEILAEVGSPNVYQMIGKLYSDDRESIDLAAISHIPGQTFTDFTLQEMASAVNAIPGWSAVLASSFPGSVWNDANGPAAWAMGSGAYFQGGLSGNWTVAIDLIFGSSSLQIVAQSLYDQVQGYPGIGDPWEGTGYPTLGSSDAMPVRVSKFMRGRIEGMTLPGAGSVYVFDPPDSTVAESSGSAGSSLYYQSGLPYILNSDQVAVANGNPATAPNFQFENQPRLSRRGTIRTLARTVPKLDESTDGILAEVDLVSSPNGGFDLICKTSYRPVPPFAFETKITTSGGYFAAHPCILQDQRILIAALQVSGSQNALTVFLSNDLGQTFVNFFSLSSTTMQQVDIRQSPDGGILMIGYVPDSGTSGPGTFSGYYRPQIGSAWLAPFALTDGTSALRTDGSGFGFDAAFDSASRWVIAFIPAGGTSPVLYSSADNGKTWTLRT